MKTPAQEEKQTEKRRARNQASRAWVSSRPEEERMKMRAFFSKLLITADQGQGKVTAEGIGAFLTEYVHGMGKGRMSHVKGRKSHERQEGYRA